MGNTLSMLFAPGHLILLALVAIPLFAIHFLPAIISGTKKTKNFWWIFAVDFFLGWTVVGWIVALVWALRDEPRYAVGETAPSPYNR